MKRIILITGGSRSGKSSYAEKLALALSPAPVYLATARIWDDEFRERVRRHQERRGPQWTNIEEEKQLSRHDLTGRVVVVDCMTLWATNFFFDLESDVDRSLQTNSEHFGSHELTEAIINKRPRFVFCGHIHTGLHGGVDFESCRIYNVSRLDERYEIAYEPTWVEV